MLGTDGLILKKRTEPINILPSINNPLLRKGIKLIKTKLVINFLQRIQNPHSFLRLQLGFVI